MLKEIPSFLICFVLRYLDFITEEYCIYSFVYFTRNNIYILYILYHTQPILYHWKILNSKHKTIVDTSMQISNPKFNYTFTETGMYEVQLRAVNNISDISTTTLTHVEQKIVGGELYVVSNGSHTSKFQLIIWTYSETVWTVFFLSGRFAHIFISP